MLFDNNGNVKPIVWVITAAALVGALMISGKGKGSKGGKGQDGVYIERSQAPCPTRGRGRGGEEEGGGWGGRGEEASWGGGRGEE